MTFHDQDDFSGFFQVRGHPEIIVYRQLVVYYSIGTKVYLRRVSDGDIRGLRNHLAALGRVHNVVGIIASFLGHVQQPLAYCNGKVSNTKHNLFS